VVYKNKNYAKNVSSLSLTKTRRDKMLLKVTLSRLVYLHYYFAASLFPVSLQARGCIRSHCANAGDFRSSSPTRDII